jgi:hypothetical protein
MVNRILFLLLSTIGISCSCLNKNTLEESRDISILIKESNGRLELDNTKTYYLDQIVNLPSGFTLDGNDATIKVKPQKDKILAAFIIGGNNITVKNINLESESLFTMVGHRDKVKTNPLTSNVYAFANRNPYFNFKLLDSNFSNISRILKLSGIKGVMVENVKGVNCQTTIYCQYCSDVVLRALESDRSNATNRYTHHLYFNSVDNLLVTNSKFSNGAGKAINIKVNDINYPSNNVKIYDVELDGTGGVFLTHVEDVVIENLKSLNTKQLLVCSSAVGDVEIRNSEIFSINDSGPTIIALGNKEAVNSLKIIETNFYGPINIGGHSIKQFEIDNCGFNDFFYHNLNQGQNVFYMKKDKFQGKFTIKNSRFIQNLPNKKSIFIRNEMNNNFHFENNYVEFKYPQEILIRSRDNTTSYFRNNELIGVKKISKNMKSIRSNE